MRYTLLISIVVLFFTACKKDKYTTAPQIVFKSFKPAEGSNYSTTADPPLIVLEVTDAEGDLGLIKGKDTSKVYIKNMLTLKEDSMLLPDLQTVSKSNFKATLEISLYTVMGGRSLPVNQRPYSDNLQFQVYVKDFAKNKSNVILTDKTFTYYTLP
jgi:predicted lipoprotein with Yx(FWY)xxD motif